MTLFPPAISQARNEPKIMNEPEDKIHVIPLGEHWEVEAQSGAPLAHADDKATAIEDARSIAKEHNIDTIILHDGDGVTEKISPGGA